MILTDKKIIAILKLKPEILDKLPLEPQQKLILRLKYNLYPDKTWDGVAQALKVSGTEITGERVRQIATKTLRKLKYKELRNIIIKEADIQISIRE